MSWLSYILFIFILYSFLGWVLEEIYCFIVTGRFKEDGFLNGPFKPMYGFAMAIIIYISEFTMISNTLLWTLFFIVPTTVEYISGYLMKKVLNKMYWDYSDHKFNIDGFVCLRFSLYWIFLTTFVVYILQPLVSIMFYNYFDFISNISPLFIGYILIDFVMTTSSLNINYKAKD